MRVFLNPSFDTPIFASRSNRLDKRFQLKEIEVDKLVLSTHEQEKIEAEVLDADLRVEEEEKKIYSSLGLQHTRKIIKIQAFYGTQYGEGHNYQSFKTLTFTPDNKSALGKVYTKKGPIGHIFMVHQDIQRECKRLNALLMAAYRYNKVLDWELATLAEEKEYCWSIEEALRN